MSSSPSKDLLPMEEFERQFIAFMTPPGKSDNDALWKVAGRGEYWLRWLLMRPHFTPEKAARFAAQIEGGSEIWRGICWERQQARQALNEIMMWG